MKLHKNATRAEVETRATKFRSPEVQRERLRRRLQSYARKFEDDKDNGAVDSAVGTAFRSYPDNELLDGVLIKVSVLNALYNTGVLDVFKLAKQVWTLRLDGYLAKGDPKAINVLRKRHGIKTKNGTPRDFYSFATVKSEGRWIIETATHSMSS